MCGRRAEIRRGADLEHAAGLAYPHRTRDEAIFVNVDVFNVLDKKSVNANATVNSNSVST